VIADDSDTDTFDVFNENCKLSLVIARKDSTNPEKDTETTNGEDQELGSETKTLLELLAGDTNTAPIADEPEDKNCRKVVDKRLIADTPLISRSKPATTLNKPADCNPSMTKFSKSAEPENMKGRMGHNISVSVTLSKNSLLPLPKEHLGESSDKNPMPVIVTK
jgi:hypothetical protein